jgi:hypothetical protein
MKKLYCFSLCVIVLAILFSFTIQEIAYAQKLIVTLGKPPVGQFKQSDLWNAMIINNSNETYRIYLYGTLTEKKAGLIATGTTTDFDVVKGTKQIKGSDFPQTPDITYPNSDPKYKEAMIKKGSLPPGDYNYCLYAKLKKNNEELGMDCFDQTIEDIGMISLISPNDGEELDPKIPIQFTWMSTQIRGDANYTLKIVEIREGQSPEVALQKNNVWFEQSNIKTPTFQYPKNARSFEVGKKYAWGIFNNNMMSEFKSFIGGSNTEVSTKYGLQNCNPTNSNWIVGGNTINDFIYYIGTCNEKPLAIGTNNLEKIRISTDGKIGIGTADPLTNLHIFSDDVNNYPFITVEGNNPGIRLNDNSIYDDPELVDFNIVASNGVGRIISDKSAAIFLDKNNNYTNAFFSVLAHEGWWGSNVKELMKISTSGNTMNVYQSSNEHWAGYFENGGGDGKGVYIKGGSGTNAGNEYALLRIDQYNGNTLFKVNGKGNTMNVYQSSNEHWAGYFENGGGDGKGVYIKGGSGTNAGNEYALLRIDRYDGNTLFKVNGKSGITYARQIKVTLDNFPDYVFKPGYILLSVDELEKYIMDNKHLPGISSADEIIKGGLDLGKISSVIVEKIEEIVLYLIQQSKNIKKIKQQNDELLSKVEKLEKENVKINKRLMSIEKKLTK